MKSRYDVIVGTVMLLGALLVGGGTIWLANAGFGAAQRVTAEFQQVGQLAKGNPVKLRGVPIGQVRSIRLAPGGTGVSVRMRIAPDAALPADPVALASPQSMFGDWQIEIVPRSRYPRYAYARPSNDLALPGYALPDVSQITAVADRIAENMAVLTDRIEIAFTEETARNVRQAINNIVEVSDELAGLVASQKQAVQELTAELGDATQTLNDAATYASRAFRQVDAAVSGGQLDTIMVNARQASARIDSLSRALLRTTEQIQAITASAGRSFGRVDSITARIGAGQGTFGMLVNDTTLYRQLIRTNIALQHLLNDIEENPDKYFKVEVF